MTSIGGGAGRRRRMMMKGGLRSTKNLHSAPQTATLFSKTLALELIQQLCEELVHNSTRQIEGAQISYESSLPPKQQQQQQELLMKRFLEEAARTIESLEFGISDFASILELKQNVSYSSPDNSAPTKNLPIILHIKINKCLTFDKKEIPKTDYINMMQMKDESRLLISSNLKKLFYNSEFRLRDENDSSMKSKTSICYSPLEFKISSFCRGQKQIAPEHSEASKSYENILFINSINTKFLAEYVRLSGVLAMKKTERWCIVACTALYTFYRLLWYKYFAGLYFYTIYLLASAFASLSPAGTSDNLGFSEMEIEHGLPKISEDLSKPFARKLPECVLSKNIFAASVLAILASCFEIFQIDVYWPILVMYVAFLFVVFTIKHWTIYSRYMRNHGFNIFGFSRRNTAGNPVFL